MNSSIQSPSGFLRWATREKGPRWFEDEQILNYYGKAQIMELFPQFFPKQLERQIKCTMEQNLAGKTYMSESILKYPTPFDEELSFDNSLKLPMQNTEPYQLVKNIFNLDYSFDASKVKLNTDRLLAEVNGIFKNDDSRNERSYQQVLEHTIMGHKLEQYLIDNNSFIDDERKYMDLISPQGFSVDCKVVSSYHSGTAPFLVQKILDRASYSPKINFVVIYQKLGDIYEYRETVEIF